MALTLISCAFDGGGRGGGEGAESGVASISAAAHRLKTPRRLGTGRCSAVWFVSDPAKFEWAHVGWCAGCHEADHSAKPLAVCVPPTTQPSSLTPCVAQVRAVAEPARRAGARAFPEGTGREHTRRRLRVCESPPEAEGEWSAMHGDAEAEDHLRSQRVLLFMETAFKRLGGRANLAVFLQRNALPIGLDIPWYDSEPTYARLTPGSPRHATAAGQRRARTAKLMVPRCSQGHPMRCRVEKAHNNRI